MCPPLARTFHGTHECVLINVIIGLCYKVPDLVLNGLVAFPFWPLGSGCLGCFFKSLDNVLVKAHPSLCRCHPGRFMRPLGKSNSRRDGFTHGILAPFWSWVVMSLTSLEPILNPFKTDVKRFYRKKFAGGETT